MSTLKPFCAAIIYKRRYLFKQNIFFINLLLSMAYLLKFQLIIFIKTTQFPKIFPLLQYSTWITDHIATKFKKKTVACVHAIERQTISNISLVVLVD